eukprot:2140295-Pyramimonas_sp.AAC.1
MIYLCKSSTLSIVYGRVRTLLSWPALGGLAAPSAARTAARQSESSQGLTKLLLKASRSVKKSTTSGAEVPLVPSRARATASTTACTVHPHDNNKHVVTRRGEVGLAESALPA